MPNDVSLPSTLEFSTSPSCVDAAQEHIGRVIDSLLASLPDPDRLTARRAVQDHCSLHGGARGQLHLLDDRYLSLGPVS